MYQSVAFCRPNSPADASPPAHSGERAGDGRLARIRDQAVQMFNGSTQVEEWESLCWQRNHRSCKGACTRAIWLKTVSDQRSRSMDRTGHECFQNWKNSTGSAAPA